jgi:glutathione S-transferase
VILMGLIRTPEAERDYPAIHAAQDACENLFAMMDDELAKHAWFSGEAFGVGDIAVAPFVWNLTNMGLKWTPRPHLALAAAERSPGVPQRGNDPGHLITHRTG